MWLFLQRIYHRVEPDCEDLQTKGKQFGIYPKGNRKLSEFVLFLSTKVINKVFCSNFLFRNHFSPIIPMVIAEAIMLVLWPIFCSVVWLRNEPIRNLPLGVFFVFVFLFSFLLIMRVGLLPIPEVIRCKPITFFLSVEQILISKPYASLIQSHFQTSPDAFK